MPGSSIYARLQNAYPSFWHNHLQSKQAGTYRQKQRTALLAGPKPPSQRQACTCSMQMRCQYSKNLFIHDFMTMRAQLPLVVSDLVSVSFVQ